MRLVRQLGVEGESLLDCVSIHVRAFHNSVEYNCHY